LLGAVLDGEETSYFEWLGAGCVEVGPDAGAAGTMHRVAEHSSLVTLVQFGFDVERLLVRVDAVQKAVDLLADGREVSLKFLTPPGVRFSIRQQFGRLVGTFWDRHDAQPSRPAFWVERDAGGATLAAGSVLEIALPLADLGVAAGDVVSFFVALYGAGGVETERHPAHQPIDLQAPTADFEAGTGGPEFLGHLPG
jgi:hypothetical protein